MTHRGIDLWDGLRALGPAGVWRRVSHIARKRLGRYRVRPDSEPTCELSLPSLGPARDDALGRFFAANPAAVDGAVRDAERILSGEHPYFGGQWLEVGWPPRWNRDPLSGRELDMRGPWTSWNPNSHGVEDIKWVWEAARFGSTFPLLRAYVATGAAHFAEGFWEGLESFWRHNPPFTGPNWICGQETSLRALTALFGLAALKVDSTATASRRDLVARLVWASALRVEDSLDYALSQRNNHALSELVFLYTAGRCFPAAQRASRWRKKALRHLKGALSDQFAADGGYAQHSFNYQRLALHVLLWAHWLAGGPQTRDCGDDDRAMRRLLRPVFSSSLGFLVRFADRSSGQLPNYGNNDGALLFDLCSVGRRDFRPLLQHLAQACDARRPFAPGVWDEEGVWFLGAPKEEGRLAAREPPAASFARQTVSGYVVSRQGESTVSLRAPRYRNRPGQADALHVDLWVGSRNVALDPGTYSYNLPDPWRHALACTRVHNTASVGGADQMHRVSRFLYTRWTQADVRFFSYTPDRSVVLLETSADARQTTRFQRLVVHEVGRLAVFDRLVRAGHSAAEPLEVHWNLDAGEWGRGAEPQNEAELELVSAGVHFRLLGPARAEFEMFSGPDHDARGWSAPTYGVREPCLYVLCRASQDTAHFRTVFEWPGGQNAVVELESAWARWREGRVLEAAEGLA